MCVLVMWLVFGVVGVGVSVVCVVLWLALMLVVWLKVGLCVGVGVVGGWLLVVVAVGILGVAGDVHVGDVDGGWCWCGGWCWLLVVVGGSVFVLVLVLLVLVDATVAFLVMVAM